MRDLLLSNAADPMHCSLCGAPLPPTNAGAHVCPPWRPDTNATRGTGGPCFETAQEVTTWR